MRNCGYGRASRIRGATPVCRGNRKKLSYGLFFCLIWTLIRIYPYRLGKIIVNVKGLSDNKNKETSDVTNSILTSPGIRIDFPLDHAAAQRQTLERLYERKATLEALIESLEAYARCRTAAQVMAFP